MYGWVIDAVTGFVHSPWLLVVVLAVLIGGAFLPGLPGGTTLLTATAATAPDWRSTAAVAVTAFAGALIGDLIGHALGRHYGTRLLAHRRLRRLRRPVLRARTAMRRHPTPVLAGGRFLPGGRLTSVLAAGISRVRLARMLAVTVPVAAVWTAWMTALGVLGSAVAGNHVLGGPAAALTISAVTTVAVVGVGAIIARRSRGSALDQPA
ncbi:VTT domain-containing protein [Nakamurella lactea]|uniref:VTT domain-containing protein n=1 Tax=Nakamurella lactea TaxID=459515 RepID=UPI00041698A0|nr:VTT domain-containing protein [Nakamurella lactea]